MRRQCRSLRWIRTRVFDQPQVFLVLAAGLAPDPAVNVLLNAVTAEVVASDKNELVLTAAISA